MNATTARQPRPVTLVSILLLGIAVLFALLFYAVLRYPASLSQGGHLSLLVIAGALLVYGAAALWLRQASSASLQLALEQGARIGLLLGAFAVVNHVLEIFAALDSSLGAILGVSMWALLFLAFGGVASATYQRFGSLGLAIIASLWCALVSTVMTLLAGYTIALLFMPHMQQLLQSAYAQSAMTDPQAFVIHNTLSSGASHALLTPIIGLVFGCAGGIAGMLLGLVQRGVAVALGIGELLLVTAGLAQELKAKGVRLIVLEQQIAAIPLLKTYMKSVNPYVNITLHDNLQMTTGDSRAFLGRIGIAGEIVWTPGHSDDSVSLVLDEGSAFTGDLPLPGFVDEKASDTVRQSWDTLRALRVRMIYPGHGPLRPLASVTVVQKCDA